MAFDDQLEQALGLGVLLLGLFLGGLAVVEWSIDPLDDSCGDRHLLGPGLALLGEVDHLLEAGAIFVGLDLIGDDLGEHQVVVGLPALLGLAVAELLERLEPLLDGDQDA